MTERDGQQDVRPGQLLLAEYQSVKDEQKARIGFRDNLLYVTLTVVAAVVAAAAQAAQTAMLLALPPVCVVLGWTYLVNDEKISAAGRYVRQDLGPRLAELAGVDVAFGWEAYHRGDARRVSRKIVQCVVDLLAFCVVPLAALVVYWCGGQVTTGLLVLSLAEAAAVAGLGVFVVRYAVPFAAGGPVGGAAAGE
ncbi:hypothetical protein [Streptomyces hilarionis]|uniref:hypothetical protein n=1 Tax=Streptomyces hilarionis TaxID=2839954 RepID=UPI00211A9629|nr:hypothetical protein [Streptomyces hilarionis]MCQ9136388.1 hypothetical protein [Streptomyces hilarionis]